MTTTTTTTGRQRRHEAPELGAMIRRMTRALVRRAAEGDTEALEQLAQLERELPVATSSALGLMNHAGDPTRAAGHTRTAANYYSAGELAQVLGTSRQAVRQRIGRVDVDDAAAAYFTDGRSTSLSWGGVN